MKTRITFEVDVPEGFESIARSQGLPAPLHDVARDHCTLYIERVMKLNDYPKNKKENRRVRKAS